MEWNDIDRSECDVLRRSATGGEHQITAIPKLLEQLDLEGHLVTTDAMGAQIPISQTIIDKKADYLFSLKGNQGNTEKEVRDHFEIALRQLDFKKAKGWSVSQDHEIAHGRDTTRSVLCTTNLTSLVPEIRDRWPELKSLIMVESDTRIVSTGKERKKERRCYFSSREEDAEFFQKAIRLHWSFENQCHWVLDTCFREDHNRTRKGKAAKNLGAVRRIVLNILKNGNYSGRLALNSLI